MKIWASRVLTLLTRAVGEFFDDRGNRLAAQVAYQVLFSLFPLAIVLAAGFGLVVNDAAARHRVINFILTNVPVLSGTSSHRQLEQVLHGVTTNATALGPGALIAMVWTSTSMMGSIRDALNRAWDTVDDRPFFRGKLVDLGLVALVGTAVAGSAALTITIGSWVAPVAASFVGFTLAYLWIPSTKTTLRSIWPGALLAAILFELAKRGFGLYVTHFGHYNAIYGSLGLATIFLFFVFISANILILGAEAASEWPAIAAGRYDHEEAQPLGRRVGRFVRGLFVRVPQGRT